VKMLALGLSVSVLLDASVIRLTLVPATMFLLGEANWWTPRWLDRLLPHPNANPEAEGEAISPEAPAVAVEPALAPVPSVPADPADG